MTEQNRYLLMLRGDILYLPNRGTYQIYEYTLKGSMTGCLLVLKARNEVGFWVAFFGAGSPEACIDKALAKARSGDINWKADRYRGTIGEKEPSR